MTDDEIIHRLREQDAAGELPTPAPPKAVAELETAVGHPMPPLLKRIHLEVAHGHALFPEDLTLAARLCGWLDGWEDSPEALAGTYCPDR